MFIKGIFKIVLGSLLITTNHLFNRNIVIYCLYLRRIKSRMKYILSLFISLLFFSASARSNDLLTENGTGDRNKVDTTFNGLDIKTDVLVYPNPFTNDVTIRLGKLTKAEVKVSMTDAHGKRIMHSYFENNATSKTINTSQLAQGIYWVKIECGKESIIKEIVKQ